NSENIKKYIESYETLNQSEGALIKMESDMNLTMQKMNDLMGEELWMGDDVVNNSKVLFAEITRYQLQKQEPIYLAIKDLSLKQQEKTKKWMDMVENSEQLSPIGKGLHSRSISFFEQINQYHDENVKSNLILSQMTQRQQELQTLFSNLGQLTITKMQTVEKRAKVIILVGVAIAFLAGIFVAIILIRGITGPIHRITRGMNEGSTQVAVAAGQVSSSSQSMAEGASRQAAAIEETSSSMEEMASMTKKNAENATHADTLMKEVSQVVQRANGSMAQLTGSMAEISKASEETSKIIKTIDEIAFQTNLLALNAAVEAARAGEAGAGFAVVADEVRNLAMRAADAAKNTEKLIEEILIKVKDGSTLVGNTNDAFGQVSQSTEKVGHLVFEISEASMEQSSGIDQVNIAIADVDKVIQHTVVNADSSATSAEEMRFQAELLRGYVEELIVLMTGSSQSMATSSSTPTQSTPTQSISQHSGAVRIPQKELSGKSEIRSDQVIPFDEEIF
ncbi:MAG: methyl-accepting chemotaxis protein, partial [Desulfobacterium sp.]